MAEKSSQAEGFFKAESYKEKPHAWPGTDNGYTEKDEAWFLRVCKAMYSDYVRDRGGIPYSRRFDFNLMRLYAEGNQPVDKYMNILDPEDGSKQSDREGFMNVSWDIVSVAPKFRRIIESKLEKMDMDFQAHAISPTALKNKEDVKWNLWAESRMRDFFKEMQQKMGMESEGSEFLPEDMEELELFMEERFKLKQELAIENAVEYSLYLSQWPEIKRRMINDFFDIGIAACQDIYDPIDGKIKARYLDPSKLITRYSREKDFSNIDYWGYIEEMSISELRARTNWDEKKIYQIAKRYATWADNPTFWNWSDYYSIPDLTQTTNTEMPYDCYRIQVMYSEIISAETETYKMKTVSDGSIRTYKESKNSNPKNGQIERHKYQITFGGYWILGTDFVFDYGKPYLIPRQDPKKPLLSINIYRYQQKSLVAQIIPFLDGFQLAWLKLQNALANAAPAGLSIEVGTLENISVGGSMMNPLDILSIRRKTGDLLYKATTHHSQINGTPGRPVDELMGGIGSQLNEFTSLMEYNLNMIREITGVNEMLDASTPSSELPVRSGIAAMEAGNNALGPLMSGYFNIKDRCCRKFALRYQVMASQGTIKGMYPALGKNTVQMFELTKDVSMEDYAMVMRSRPSEMMKQSVRAAAQKSLQLGSRQGGIKDSDYLFIEDQLDNGNIKYARIFLSYKEKKYAKEAEQLQQQNMQLNGQNMMQQEQAKSQSEQMKLQGETQKEIAILQAKSEMMKQELALKHEHKMQEIALENSGRNQVAQMNKLKLENKP